jgi:hypothetical protein
MTWLIVVLAALVLGYGIRRYLRGSTRRKQVEREKRQAAVQQRERDLEDLRELEAALQRPLNAGDGRSAPPPET